MPYVIDVRNILQKVPEVFVFTPDTFLRWLNEGRETASGERNEEVKRRLQAYVDPWLATGLGHDPDRPNQECASLRNYHEVSNSLAMATSTEFVLATLIYRAFMKLGPGSGQHNSEYDAIEWGLTRVANNSGGWQRHVSAEQAGAWLTSGGDRVVEEEERPQACPKDEDFAGRLFTLFLLNADWKNEIAKCRYHRCGIYFRWRFPNKPRINGLFCCPKHQQAASSGAKYKPRAKATHQRLVEHAATKYREWLNRSVGWQSKTPVKEWLTNQINSFIASDPELRRLGMKNKIHVNWVTWHRKEIGL